MLILKSSSSLRDTLKYIPLKRYVFLDLNGNDPWGGCGYWGIEWGFLWSQSCLLLRFERGWVISTWGSTKIVSILLGIFHCIYDNKNLSSTAHYKHHIPQIEGSSSLLCQCAGLALFMNLSMNPSYLGISDLLSFLPSSPKLGGELWPCVPPWYLAKCLAAGRWSINPEPWQEALECIRNILTKTSCPQPQPLTEE